MNQIENDGLSKVEEDFSLKEFLQFLLRLPFYSIILICNALRLRCPFFRKNYLKAEIIEKEESTVGTKMPFDETGFTVDASTFLLHLKIGHKKAFIVVDKIFYDKHFEGDKLPIEYIDGFDRIHARPVSA